MDKKLSNNKENLTSHNYDEYSKANITNNEIPLKEVKALLEDLESSRSLLSVCVASFDIQNGDSSKIQNLIDKLALVDEKIAFYNGMIEKFDVNINFNNKDNNLKNTNQNSNENDFDSNQSHTKLSANSKESIKNDLNHKETDSNSNVNDDIKNVSNLKPVNSIFTKSSDSNSNSKSKSNLNENIPNSSNENSPNSKNSDTDYNLQSKNSYPNKQTIVNNKQNSNENQKTSEGNILQHNNPLIDDIDEDGISIISDDEFYSNSNALDLSFLDPKPTSKSGAAKNTELNLNKKKANHSPQDLAGSGNSQVNKSNSYTVLTESLLTNGIENNANSLKFPKPQTTTVIDIDSPLSDFSKSPFSLEKKRPTLTNTITKSNALKKSKHEIKTPVETSYEVIDLTDEPEPETFTTNSSKNINDGGSNKNISIASLDKNSTLSNESNKVQSTFPLNTASKSKSSQSRNSHFTLDNITSLLHKNQSQNQNQDHKLKLNNTETIDLSSKNSNTLNSSIIEVSKSKSAAENTILQAKVLSLMSSLTSYISSAHDILSKINESHFKFNIDSHKKMLQHMIQQSTSDRIFLLKQKNNMDLKYYVECLEAANNRAKDGLLKFNYELQNSTFLYKASLDGSNNDVSESPFTIEDNSSSLLLSSSLPQKLAIPASIPNSMFKDTMLYTHPSKNNMFNSDTSNNSMFNSNTSNNSMFNSNTSNNSMFNSGNSNNSIFINNLFKNDAQLNYTPSTSLGLTFDKEADLLASSMKPKNFDFHHYLINSSEIPTDGSENFGAMRSNTDLAKDIAQLMDNIQYNDEDENDKKTWEGTPKEMNINLMEHQKRGLSWLIQMEKSSKGGILGDDMGLGKTIQTIALILARKSPNINCKTTLIVAPVALAVQWYDEIKSRVKKSCELNVLIYHGPNRKSFTFKQLNEFDVVITTYGTLRSEFASCTRLGIEDAKNNSDNISIDPNSNNPFFNSSSKFYRVVLDESQFIKNKNTKGSLACWKLNAVHRWCLSGTPMQNNVDELYSTLRFLRIKPYNEFSHFSASIARPLRFSAQPSRSALRKLQALLRSIMLRRTHKSKINGKPILSLPEKTIELIHCSFNAEEQRFYSSLEEQSANEVNNLLESGEASRNIQNIFVMLLRLREACDHIWVCRDKSKNSSSLLNSLNMKLDQSSKIRALTKKLPPDVVKRIKEKQNFECSVCLDVVEPENVRIFYPCGHDCCADCLLYLKEKDETNGIAAGTDSRKILQCPTCRSSYRVDEVIEYLIFRSVHMQEIDTNSENTNKEVSLIRNKESDNLDKNRFYRNEEREVSSMKDVPFILENAGPFEVRSLVDNKLTESNTELIDLTGDNNIMNDKNNNINKKKDDKINSRTNIFTYCEYNGHDKLKKIELKKLLKKHWKTSAKLEKCKELIIKNVKEQKKTIIFSQFTDMLDLVEVILEEKGWGFSRYDGSMSTADREQSLRDFRTTNSVALLMSLRAGNVGLNLCIASSCIILDPFWNPFVEEQAIGRAHRIGQTRPVTVYRIVISATVEDRILNLQEKKRNLVQGALDEKSLKDISRLGLSELQYLFGIGSEPT